MKENLLGQFIRDQRNERGMSLRQFGEMCEISHTTIDSIEKGYDPRTMKEVNITNATFGKLSRALHVPIWELVELSQGNRRPLIESNERPSDPLDEKIMSLVFQLSLEQKRALIERIEKILASR